MCPEIHEPTTLDSAMVQEYIEFIEQTGTKHFGLNIDFGIFREKKLPKDDEKGRPPFRHSRPEELGLYLPYVYCCHAKFIEMSDDLEELYIPMRESCLCWRNTTGTVICSVSTKVSTGASPATPRTRCAGIKPC